VVGAGFTAFDCRSGLAWPNAAAANQAANKIESVTARTNRTTSMARVRMLSGPMFKVISEEEVDNPLW
jgi:hypothetical protein